MLYFSLFDKRKMLYVISNLLIKNNRFKNDIKGEIFFLF